MERMVRLAREGWGKARVRRRAALLRACAVAALAAQPALAAPNHRSPDELVSADARPQHLAIPSPGGAPLPATINGGAFDVAVTPPAAAGPGKSGDSNGNKPDL